MKLTKRELHVLQVVRDHGHLTALAVGTLLEPKGWDERRRENLGEAIVHVLRAKGLMERSTPINYWRVSTMGRAQLKQHTENGHVESRV